MAVSEHIVILGGGFAGAYAARSLALRLFSGHSITLIDRVGHMLYTPMLTEVAGGTVPGKAIAVSNSRISRRVKFIKAEIASVDTEALTVSLQDGAVIQATQLVIALGSTSDYHGIEGAEENSLPLKTLKDAEVAGARIEWMVRTASAEDLDLEERKRLLTLVVAGGGYTGVETMAALYARLRREATAAGLGADIKAVLIEPSDRLMHEMPEDLAAYGRQRLERDGVHVVTGVSVKGVSPEGLVLSNGDRHHPGLLIWDTGIEPSPLLKQIDVPKGKHHGVVVDSAFRVAGKTNIWAIGDCAEIPNPDTKENYAPTAQNAVREGAHLAKNIAGFIRGREPQPFRYKMLGQLALISEHDAVASLLGVPVHGALAWGIWWAIYLAKLPGVLNRIRVAQALAKGA